MKAYICTTEYDGTGGVVFAKSNIHARRIAADEWNDGELGGLHVNRASSLDQYYGKGVPAKVLIRDFGWQWEDGCGNCGQGLSDWQLEDNGIPIDGVIGTDSSLVFCCQACCDKHWREKEMKDKAGQYVIGDLINRLHSKFNGAIVKRAHHFTTGRNGLYTTEQAIIEFDFPGSKYGAAIRYEHPIISGCTKTLPHYPFFICANGDMDAWNAWVNA